MEFNGLAVKLQVYNSTISLYQGHAKLVLVSYRFCHGAKNF